MKSSAKKKNCTKFEPQTWRPSRCKNCFRSEAQHPTENGEECDGGKDDAVSKQPEPLAHVESSKPATTKENSSEQSGSPSKAHGPGPDRNSTGEDKPIPEAAAAKVDTAAAAGDAGRGGQAGGSTESGPLQPTTVSYVASHTPRTFGPRGQEGGQDSPVSPPVSAPRGSPNLEPQSPEGDGWASPQNSNQHAGGFDDISRSAVSPSTPPESPVDAPGLTSPDPNRSRSFHLIRRQRAVDGAENEGGRRRRRRRESVEDMYGDMSREDAMAEGTRLMLETLRDKLGVMEDRCDRLDREKAALGDLLAVRKAEFNERDLEHRGRLEALEDKVTRLSAENNRLQDRLKLPETERNALRDQENEIVDLRNKLESTENRVLDLNDDNQSLQQEINDLHLEMDEMHDQFREDEALEFRELQKELEATAKNCRILQFKLRKADRRNELIESERVQYEDKIRQLERRFECDDKNHMQELEEELRMAKEVSVRLHDELEMVEERRIKADEELNRVQDYLRESESRRLALQQEVESLNGEVEQLREQLSRDDITKLEVPKERPTLRKIGSQGSTEYDVESLMRDLSDHLERENDLKEQLNHAEEENSILRKKIEQIEDENESINVQLQKMSSARSGKYFKGDTKTVITEEAHELALQLELMENETTILRRKLAETEQETDDLRAEVTFLKEKLSDREASPQEEQPDDRPYDERISAMAMDIDELKWKLIQKDQQVEKLIKSKDETSKKGTLKKSKSLDSDATLDIRKQLDMVQQEATVLKEKVENLEIQNDRLIMENQKMSHMKIPVVTADDSALQNIELQERVKTLEAENNMLNKKVKDKTDRLARLASGVKSRDDANESRELQEALGVAEDDCIMLRTQLAAVESRCTLIMEELCKQTGKSESELTRQLSLGEEMKLGERVKDLESELRDMQTVVKNREDENDRLLEEINGYRDDIDNMMETFRGREKELLDEVEMLSNKNSVITNLLDMVTERTAASQTSTASEASTLSAKSDKERSASTVSALSDVSMGSDEVFGSERPSVSREWDEQYMRRIAWLEQMLEEEHKKTAAAAANLSEPQSAMTDDAKLFEREKEILQKELSLCQKQLSETNDLVKDLKTRLTNVEQARDDLRKDYDKSTKDLERERQHRLDKMLEAEKSKAEAEAEAKKGATLTKRMSTGSIKDKEPASWRWEKQELERSIKDWKKKADDLDLKLKRQTTKLKSTSGAGKEEKLKEQVEKLIAEKDKIKEERDKFRTQAEEFESTMKEIQETLGRKSKQWETEREILETDKKAAEKETVQKDDVIKQKDEIISQKDVLVKQKEVANKEKEESLTVKENIIKQKEDEFTKKTEALKIKEDEYVKTKDLLQCKEELVIDLEAKLKTLDEHIRTRDERLTEKDDVIEKLNKDLSEKEVRASIMETSMNEANDKLRDKEAELNEIKSVADDYAKKARTFEEQLRDLEDNLNKVLRERDKETAALVIQREKLENQLEFITREKKCADDEIKLLRKTLAEREEDWGRQKCKYESDLDKNKENLLSLEKLQSAKGNEVVKDLTNERDKLLKDRTRLEDVIKKLRSEVEKCRESQAEEVAELRKVLYEAKKRLDEKARECSRLHAELSSLKEQHGVASRGGSSLSETPDASIALTSPSMSLSSPSPVSPDTSFDAPDFSGALERQELLFRAEKVGMEELYEARLRVLQDQLAHAQAELANLRMETGTQKELLENSAKTLSEFKNKYDIDVTSWNEERTALEKKAEQGITYKREHDEIQKSIEHIALRLREEESMRIGVDNRFSLEKKNWEVERLSLIKEINELKKSLGRPFAPDKGSKELQKIIDETKKLTNQMDAKLKASETNRQTELRDWSVKMEQSRRDFDKERKELEEHTSKLEDRAKQLGPLQRTLIDLQYKMHSYRESWLRERTELQKQVDEARRSQLDEKQKFVDMISEIKRVKTLMPRAESETRSTASRSSSTDTHRSETVIRLSSSTSMMIDEALERITQIADDLTQAPRRRQNQSRAPPAFRRSLSSSEAEIEIAMQKQWEVERNREDETHQKLDRLDWQRRSAPPSTLSASKRLDQMLRVKSQDRSPSPDEEEEVSVTRAGLSYHTNESRSRTVVRRQHSQSSADQSGYPTGSLERPSRKAKRSSIHSSGTQSAYSSRDASPEKGVRKSPYPAPPPSFFITPPRSPRTFQPSPHCSILTSSNMMKLYAKLGAMDRATSSESIDSNASMGLTASAAIAQERTAALRVLAKSQSVDAAEDDMSWRRSGGILPERLSFIELKMQSKVFEDAPLSETLPASIRIGELIITPGIEKLCKGIAAGKVKSPQASRKNTGTTSPGQELGARRPSFIRSQSVEPKTFAVVKPKSEKLAARMLPFLSRAQSEDKDLEGATGPSRKDRGKSPKPGFFASVMDKRKLFGFRKSTSIDNSAVESGIARAGVQAATPGAPSTYEPPNIKVAEPAEESQKTHKRTTSLDFHSLFKSSTQDITGEDDSSERGRSKDQKGKDSKKKEKKKEREASKTREEKKKDKKEKKRESSKTRDASEDSSKKKEKKRDSSKTRRDSSVESTKDSKKDKKRSKSKEKKESKSKKERESTSSLTSSLTSSFSKSWGVRSGSEPRATSPSMERPLQLASSSALSAVGGRSRSTTHIDKSDKQRFLFRQSSEGHSELSSTPGSQESLTRRQRRACQSTSMIYTETSV